MITPPRLTWRECGTFLALLALCHVSIALDAAIAWLSTSAGPASAPMRAHSPRAGSVVTSREGQGAADDSPLERLRDVV